MSEAGSPLAQPSDAALEAALWARARQDGSSDARERLFGLYQAFARQVAGRHYRDRRTGDIEFGDLCQLAYAGLLEAIDHYDPGRGVPFKAYSARRIAGSVLNGLAKMSEVREQISFRNRARADRMRSLSARSADGLRPDEVLDALADLATGLALGFMLESAGLAAAEAEPDRGPSAYDSLAWKQLTAQLSSALAELPVREAMIIRQHYLGGVSFEHLASILRLSKGRVSQLHHAAIGRLRARLRPHPTFALER